MFENIRRYLNKVEKLKKINFSYPHKKGDVKNEFFYIAFALHVLITAKHIYNFFFLPYLTWFDVLFSDKEGGPPPLCTISYMFTLHHISFAHHYKFSLTHQH